MDVEAGVRPGKNPLRSFGAQQLPADQELKDLAAEEFRQPRVVEPGDRGKVAVLVHASFGHRKMKVDVKIDPNPKVWMAAMTPGLSARPVTISKKKCLTL